MYLTLSIILRGYSLVAVEKLPVESSHTCFQFLSVEFKHRVSLF